MINDAHTHMVKTIWRLLNACMGKYLQAGIFLMPPQLSNAFACANGSQSLAGLMPDPASMQTPLHKSPGSRPAVHVCNVRLKERATVNKEHARSLFLVASSASNVDPHIGCSVGLFMMSERVSKAAGSHLCPKQ